jgi:putative oxidoreductase
VTSQPDPQAWQRPASASLVDPEDDLPSSNYAGDFETTAIPRYDSAKSSAGQPFGLISDPEPLPYVEPGGRHSLGAYGAEPIEIEPGEADNPRDRRGTQDLGLLLLRLAVGAILIGHGLQKAFGLWGGPGFDGFQASLTDMGFQHADILTYVATGGQIAAGVLLVLGLFTPVAAAGALASFLTDGHEYRVIFVCALAAIILIGPGRYGLDAGRGWVRRPFIGSFTALVLGVGAGVAVWVLLNGGNPLA